MGIACARRLGPGRTVVLGDINAESLDTAAHELIEEECRVLTQVLDVSDASSMHAFANLAASSGSLQALVRTAGASPAMARPDRIYQVNPLGTALLLDAFFPLAGEGTVGVVIASMADYSISLSTATERALATSATDELLDIARELNTDDRSIAYRTAKRGNQLRVQQAAVAWGARGARLVSVSQGIISTPMGARELKTPSVAEALKEAALPRVGTPADIAPAVEWLTSPTTSFVTGTDILVDGGATASRKWH